LRLRRKRWEINPLRGELYWLDWNPARGSEQGGRRPALVIQTDPANQNPNYPNTIVAAVSTKGRQVPTHVEVSPTAENGLVDTSHVKCEQIMTISKERLLARIGVLSSGQMASVDASIKKALDLV
jgi:mRNA interferase MazF